MSRRKYYVYGHYRLTETIPFLIGKGCDKRAYEHKGRSDKWFEIFRTSGIRVTILIENLTESRAYKLEKEMIRLFGRKDLGTGPLINLTSGGYGVRNRAKSSREKTSITMTGRKRGPHSKKWRKAISTALMGNTNKKGK